MIAALAVLAVVAAAWAFWRHYWFFRNPERAAPAEAGVLAPADGTVVYVRDVQPGEDVFVIKQGVRATVEDIVKEDVPRRKLVIGIFMSPFDVHYNRAPLDGTVTAINRYPAKWGGNVSMTEMHWRSVLNLAPHYRGSMHIVQNERTVTRFEARYRDEALPLYVVQIGALTVNGIDSYFGAGQPVARGQTFGMIRVGSQVDLVMPWREGLEVRVKPGDKVVAGESILVR